jgi:hypothetical protein
MRIGHEQILLLGVFGYHHLVYGFEWLPRSRLPRSLFFFPLCALRS